jgi:hypothetical protein
MYCFVTICVEIYKKQSADSSAEVGTLSDYMAVST